MGDFFKNRMVWAGLGIVMILASLFTFAFMGSTVNPTPKEMPIAVVVEDEGIKLNNGKLYNLGAAFSKEIQKRDNSSVKWKMLKTRQAALAAMDEKKVYAAIYLPSNLSKDVFSLLTDKATEPTATIILNEGMNFSGANVALQISNNVLTIFNQQIQAQLLEQVAKMKITVTADFVKLIANPISVKIEKINRVGVNNASGNTPALFTQLLWIVTLISSIILFTLLKKVTGGNWTIKSFVSQILLGTLFQGFISGVIWILVLNVLKVEVANEWELYLTMVSIGLCYFFIHSALLNWIGYPAAPLLILLFFFSTPILTMAPEMLPIVTRDYLYSWVPFRFSVDSLKDLLFFNKGIVEQGVGTIGWMGITALGLMGMAIFKPVKKKHLVQSLSLED